MNLETLEFVLSEKGVEYMNEEWRHRSVNPRALWRAGYADDETMRTYARVERLLVRTPVGVDLEGGCREWWTRGLREEWLRPSGDVKLAWVQ